MKSSGLVQVWITFFINPNQIRMAGIPVSDNPFYDNQKIDITHEKLFIPFGTYGMTVYFDSRVSTQKEITECTHIFMASDTEWDPQ